MGNVDISLIWIKKNENFTVPGEWHEQQLNGMNPPSIALWAAMDGPIASSNFKGSIWTDHQTSKQCNDGPMDRILLQLKKIMLQ